MNISRGKIRKLRRSKSQSRKKAPKNKKKKRPRTGQNRSFRKKNYINLKNSSLKKLGKKRKRIRFQRGGDGDGVGVGVFEIASKMECEEQGKKWNPETKECEQKVDTEQIDIATGAKKNVAQIQNSEVGDTLNRNNCHNLGQEYDKVIKNCKNCDEDNGEKYNQETKKCEGDVEGEDNSEIVAANSLDDGDIEGTIPPVDEHEDYGTQLEKTNASKSKIETYVHARGNVSLAKKPALTLYKYGNIFYVKYRYPFIPKDKLDLDYSTEMNTTNLTFKPHPIWNDKPKPSKRSRIPFRTKHDEATYVKVQFHVNLKTPNKSRMQKFELQVPKLSLTFTEKINEVKLQFKDLHAPQNNKIISSKGNNRAIKFSQAIDILIPGTQDCMVNNMDSGVYSSLQSIQHRQEMDANQRINKLKLDLNKSKMNEGDATLCANKIRDMEADLLENNAMTISYDPASKNVYVSKVENLTDFAESLKINLDELHDINTNTQDPISHQNKVDSNARTTQMVKDEGMDKKTIMSKSPTIQTPNSIKKRVTPGTSSSTSSDSTATSTETEKAPDAESATVTAPDAESATVTAPDAETDKTEESSKELDNSELISVIVSNEPDAETQNENENTIPNNQ